MIEEIEGSDESDEEWSDAKQDVSDDAKPKAGGSNLVNGHGSKPEDEEEKFMPSVSTQDNQVPKKGGNDEPEVIRNIPAEEIDSITGNKDAVDGSCASRPVQNDDASAEHDNQQNRLNSETEETSQSGKVTNADRGRQNGASSAGNQTNMDEAKEAVASNPPPAPRKERPLPPVVVSMKDKALEFFKAGQYGEARDGFTQAIDRLLPGK